MPWSLSVVTGSVCCSWDVSAVEEGSDRLKRGVVIGTGVGCDVTVGEVEGGAGGASFCTSSGPDPSLT